MKFENEFEDIRSYNDHETQEVIHRLIKCPEFMHILKKVKSEQDILKEFDKVKYVNSITEFQTDYIAGYVRSILTLTIDKLSFSGLENIKENKNYLFVSNHRDIIIDSAILNRIFQQNHMPTTEIGLGDNLLIYKWITDLVKLNRGFIVKRALQGREMLQAAITLSKYIRKKITKDSRSVWIAQRSGRTKDGNDKTQPGLLKMLILSNRKNILQALDELNICPVSISYENEPCEVSKITASYYISKEIPYTKTAKEDLENMGRGLLYHKGKVHLNISKPIKFSEKISADLDSENQIIEKASTIIDNEIYKNYKFFPKNYIAYDLINNTDKYLNQKKYDDRQKASFIKKSDETVKIIQKDDKVVKHLFNQLYAYSLINFENAKN